MMILMVSVGGVDQDPCRRQAIAEGIPVAGALPFDITSVYTTSTWWTDLLQYLHGHQICIHDQDAMLVPNTTDDVFLMPEFIRRNFRTSELCMLNECRMFLRVSTLSDLVSMDGSTIESWAWEGSSPRPYLTKFQWPRSPERLSPLHWATWQRALETSFLGPNGRRTRIRMGTWLPAHLESWD
jgi:hypothetical protein